MESERENNLVIGNNLSHHPAWSLDQPSEVNYSYKKITICRLQENNT